MNRICVASDFAAFDKCDDVVSGSLLDVIHTEGFSADIDVGDAVEQHVAYPILCVVCGSIVWCIATPADTRKTCRQFACLRFSLNFRSKGTESFVGILDHSCQLGSKDTECNRHDSERPKERDDIVQWFGGEVWVSAENNVTQVFGCALEELTWCSDVGNVGARFEGGPTTKERIPFFRRRIQFDVRTHKFRSPGLRRKWCCCWLRGWWMSPSVDFEEQNRCRNINVVCGKWALYGVGHGWTT